MTNHYQAGSIHWESSGSSKGSFLFQYAQEAIKSLARGTPVRFTPEGPQSATAFKDEFSLSFYSGGTSGEPKSVKHSPATIEFAVNGLFDRIGDHPLGSVCCLPLWHVGGWMQLERACRSGGKIFFCDYRELNDPSLKGKIKGQWISLVPTQLQELMKFKEGIENLKHAKGIFVGGAGMNLRLIQSIRASGLKVNPCYGTSETAGMVSLLDSDLFLKGEDGVGKALDHAKIRINPVNQQVEIRADSLCLSRGEDLFDRGYWLKTSDLGKLDRSGNLIIHGRCDRIINTGGEKVDPTKIEKILHDTGKVSDCLVYGEQDEKWGQRVVACVSPASIDLQVLQAIVSEKLKGSMNPKVWKKMDRLPFSEMGKVPRT